MPHRVRRLSLPLSLPASLLGASLVASACAGLACSPASEETGELRASVLIGSAVFRAAQRFQVAAVYEETTDGKSVSCLDFPRLYRLGDAMLRLANLGEPGKPCTEPAQCLYAISWSGAAKEARLGPFQVPRGERVLLVVEGLASPDAGDPTRYVIARGCKGAVAFDGSAPQDVEIDVRATGGAPCTEKRDCEPDLECQTGSAFPGGYCASLACESGVPCAPGSACVLDSPTGGICANACDGPADCTTKDGYTCVRRRASAGNCAAICALPTWNVENICTL